MNKRNGIILGLLFVILVVEILIFAPKEIGLAPADIDVAAAPKLPEGGFGQVGEDVHLVESGPEGKRSELWAKRALRTKDNGEWTLETVKVKFYAANGVLYTVTGQRGKAEPNTHAIQVTGNVVTKSSNGYTFKSESAFYDSKNRKLTSPKEVEMEGPDDENGGRLQLTGGELVADFGSNEIAIGNKVRAKKKLKEGKTAQIQSERAKFSGRTNLAQFYGAVVMDVDTMRITGPEAQFAYDRVSNNFDSVLVGGGVKVTDTDKFATSNSVSVFFKDDKVVFKGAPRVVQEGDELVGDEITFLEGGKRVQVSNARAQLDPKSMEKMEKTDNAGKKN